MLKKRNDKRNTYACDSYWLRREMQDSALSTSALAERCTRLIPGIAAQYPDLEFSEDMDAAVIHSMLRGEDRHELQKFLLIAAALDLDDHQCLTRRNHIAHQLKPEERNVFMKLMRLIQLHQLPARMYEQGACIYEHLRHLDDYNDVPELANVNFGAPSWRDVCDALCPAGLCKKSKGRYVLTRPTTQDMLRRCKSRKRRFREALEDLWDNDISNYQIRNELGKRIREVWHRLKDSQGTDEERYGAADIDWQIELVAEGGDAVLFLTMLTLTPTCEQTVCFLVEQHRRTPQLPFRGEFAEPFNMWRYEWLRFNTKCVEQLYTVLMDKQGTLQQAIAETDAIVNRTVENIKAVHDALEQERRKTCAQLAYSSVH